MMRSLRGIWLALALLLCIHTVTAAPQFPLARRQDDIESTRTPTSVASQRPTSTAPPRETSASQQESERESTTKEAASSDSSSSSIVVTTSTASPPPSATASSTAPPDATATGDVPTEPLPLEPKVTPAFGIAGALLLITGVVYAVVGIKNTWIFVFGSAAYLTALCVVILIVFMMGLDASDAVQGAFFVAAFFTGVLFGALALIFADITEGLGCLLGGFCLSMWFLSLKEGGLITSTGGRAIFIGCLSAAAYSMSFSRYTRTYGLIGSISFSGATVTMIGVDCFSRAGWKEFWVYLWNIRSELFPLNTNTYPVTKGIKVELAGVVILSVFGIISQLRLWKLVQERRSRTTSQHPVVVEDEEVLDRQEAEIGRRVEDRFQRERAQWEATYGEKGTSEPQDKSGVTTPNSSGSMYDSNKEDMDVVKKDSFRVSKGSMEKYAQKQGTVTVTAVEEEDEIQQIDSAGNIITPPPDKPVSQAKPSTSHTSSTRPSSEMVAPSQMSRSESTTGSLRPSIPPPPVVIPLPFQIPKDDEARSQQSDNSSVSAIADVEQEQASSERLSPSRPFSGTTMKRSSAQPAPGDFDSEDVIMMSHADDDKASSVAATLDEEDKISLRTISPPPSPSKAKFDGEATVQEAKEVAKENHVIETRPEVIEDVHLRDTPEVAEGDKASRSSNALVAKTSAKEGSSPSPVESPRPSLTASTDPKPKNSTHERDTTLSSRLRHDTLVTTAEKSDGKGPSSGSAASGTHSAGSENGVAESMVGSFHNALPARLSKVAQSYRTNEWAKHLEAAEKPELDEITRPNSPATQLDNEKPAPVSDELAQPFAVAKRASKRVSSDSSAHPHSPLISADPISAGSSRVELHSMSRSPSQMYGRAARNSSAPLLAAPAPVNTRSSSGPVPMVNQTLLGRRESLVRNRASTQSFAQNINSSTNLLANSDEDMTLAQRKRALKQPRPPSAAQKWKQSNWASSAQVQAQGFDSHQPKRRVGSGSDEKREQLLAGWRESMQQNPGPQQGTSAMDEQQRIAMMQAKQQREMEKQQQAAASQQRQSMRDHMMRSSQMQDAHREAMRRMQASANRNA